MSEHCPGCLGQALIIGDGEKFACPGLLFPPEVQAVVEAAKHARKYSFDPRETVHLVAALILLEETDSLAALARVTAQDTTITGLTESCQGHVAYEEQLEARVAALEEAGKEVYIFAIEHGLYEGGPIAQRWRQVCGG